MKTIVLYTRRNVGLIALSLLSGFKVKVISDDEHVIWMAKEFGCRIITGFDNMGDFDIFLSVHGWQIVPMRYLEGKIAINVHPCIRYSGRNPIARYIINNDTHATIDAHIMTEIPDEGKVVHSESFRTTVCKNHGDFYNLAFPYYYRTINEVIKKVFV